MSSMANHWAARGWTVTLLTLTHGDMPLLHQLDDRVTWRDLDFSKIRRNGYPKLRTMACVLGLRKVIKESRPDAVVSFLASANIFTLLATLGTGIPVIVSERVNPAFEPMRPRWQRLRRLLYPFARIVVVQTESAKHFFSRRVVARTRVIPNAVTPPKVSGSIDAAPASKLVVGIGRLAAQKRFDRLIQAFATVAEQHRDWTLEIWGEGSDREQLEALVSKLNLAGRVLLPGYTDDVGKQLRRADLFVLSSDYEGFPNALCEAMALGVPSISTDCPSGPSEIIQHDQNGLLVPRESVEALAAALDRLMTDSTTRLRLGATGKEIQSRYSLERVMTLWEAAIADVTS